MTKPTHAPWTDDDAMEIPCVNLAPPLDDVLEQGVSRLSEKGTWKVRALAATGA